MGVTKFLLLLPLPFPSLQPGNVLVHNNRVKLCDFGAARYPDMEPMLAVAKATLEPEQVSDHPLC